MCAVMHRSLAMRGSTARRLAPIFIALLLAFAVSACGDDEGGESADTLSDLIEDTQVSTQDTSVADSGSEDVFNDATDTAYDDGCAEGVKLSRVDGVVHDEAGTPLADARAQPCLRDVTDELLCVRPDATEADGVFNQAVPTDTCWAAVTMRVIVPSAQRALMYCGVPLPEASTILTIDEPIVLPATTSAATLPPEGDATGSRTVVFEGGMEIDVVPDVLNFSGGAYEELSLAVVDPASEGVCFLSDDALPDGLFAFSPEANVESEGFALRIPNTFGYAAEQSVALYVLGGLDCALSDDTHVLEGEWREFGTATVSSDGTTIVSDTGSGLPCLTWLGVRAAGE